MRLTPRTAALTLAFSCVALNAQKPSAGEKLHFIVIMSRHGVRSPLMTNPKLDEYSAKPWPRWDVPLGYLTSHGRTLMEYMGDYYREYLTRARMLPASGCSSAEKFYFWTDTDERDIETGKAIARRMFRDCTVPVYSVPEGAPEPLFTPRKARIGKTDPQLAADSMLERMGGSPETLIEKHRAQLEEMQQILLGCDPGKTCTSAQTAGKKLLLGTPAAVKPITGGLAELAGPINLGSTFSDDFLLEYTEGMKAEDVGWGRVNKAKVTELLHLQEEYVDMVLRTPYMARANGSNLMSHMLKSMQQSIGAEALAGALGKPGDQGVVLLGHDSNESNLSGLLDMTWKTEDYPLNGRPPGSSIVFEMWKNTASGKYTVRTYFVTQTLDQMRNAVPLSLKNPPVKVPIRIPGCGGDACDWEKFQSVVGSAIDPTFVSNEPLHQTAR